MLKTEQKAQDYYASSPRYGMFPKRRDPQRGNEHQRIANVGKQYPREVSLYAVDLLSPNAPLDLRVADRIAGIVERASQYFARLK